jgi:hypothetical protein
LNDGAFPAGSSRSAAITLVSSRREELERAMQAKREVDSYALLLERVANDFATRNPHDAEGLPPGLLACYDPDDNRRNYLRIQEALSDLHLRERAELGHAFQSVIDRNSGKPQAFTFRTAQFDSMPDWIYVVAASRNLERAELLSRLTTLLGGAMAFYGRANGMVVADRDGLGFGVALSNPGAVPAPAHVEAGQRLFGHLRVTATPLHFLPTDQIR